MESSADPWRVSDTADFVCGRGYTIVTAQFPDDLLGDAATVSSRLQAACAERGHAIQVRATLFAAIRL